jgi:hypothetical protein
MKMYINISNRMCLNKEFYKVLSINILLLLSIILPRTANAQQTSPLQTGHYSPAFSHIRDMAKGSPGLAVVWYNQYSFSNKYADRNGNKYTDIPLDVLLPGLPDVDLSVDLKSFATVPALFYGVPFPILGGAQWMIGVVPSYMWADASFITERRGGVIDSVYNQSGSDRISGFGDLYVAPLGLTWGWDHFDLTFYYGFTAPTGRYETGADDNIGLGFWTHQPQLFTYYYPSVDQATAFMLGLTYELNSNIKGEDFNPGNRFSLEWGISQYLSERLELGIMGGHNWQVSDDKGSDVWWPDYRDRKSTLAFSAAYWAVKGRLYIAGKYMFDYGARQRFLTKGFMLNFIFVTNALTGSGKSE